MPQTTATPLEPPVVTPPTAIVSSPATPRSSLRLAVLPIGSRVLQNSRAPAQRSLFGRSPTAGA